MVYDITRRDTFNHLVGKPPDGLVIYNQLYRLHGWKMLGSTVTATW